jgi:uncharacterized repeat protein (TIGR04076 family)
MKMKVDENVWKYFQSHLGYSDEEIEIFKNDPRWLKIMEKSDDLLKKTIVFEVYESRACNVDHKVGDRFFFSPEGYMLAHKGPKKVCPYLMPAMAKMMFVIQERMYEGLDARPLFYKGHCDDFGLKCGGWGQVVIETKIIDRGKE